MTHIVAITFETDYFIVIYTEIKLSSAKEYCVKEIYYNLLVKYKI